MTIPNNADAYNLGMADGTRFQAIPDSTDYDIIAAGVSLAGAVSTGCAVTAQGTPNNTVAVAAGVVIINGVNVLVAAGNVTMAAAETTAGARRDIVIVNNAGTKSWVTGTPVAAGGSSAPSKPAIPANSVVLAEVLVPQGDNVVDPTQIVDKRQFAGAGIAPTAKFTAASDITVYELDPDPILSGEFTPTRSKARLVINMGADFWGQHWTPILVYWRQGMASGTRLYDKDYSPISGAAVVNAGVLDIDGFGSLSRVIDLDVSPGSLLRFEVIPAITGGSNVQQFLPSSDAASAIAITPNGTRGFITLFNSGSVIPFDVDASWSSLSDRNTLDEWGSPIPCGFGSFGVDCTNTYCVVTNFYGSSLSIIDVATEVVLRTATFGTGNPRDVAINPAGDMAAVCDAQGRIWKVTLSTGAATSVQVGAVTDDMRGVAWSSDGAYIFVGNFTTGAVHRITNSSNAVATTTGTPVSTGKPQQLRRAAVSNKIWVLMQTTNRLVSIDPATNAVVDNHPIAWGAGTATPYSFDISRKGRYAWVTYNNGYVSEDYISPSPFAGTYRTIHSGQTMTTAAGATYTGALQGPALDLYDQIWVIQVDIDSVWKWPGGGLAVRPSGGGFYGEYLEVLVYS